MSLSKPSMAANSLGYASNWLTEWFAFDESVFELLGVRAGEKIAGFIHIGTQQMHPGERARPDVPSLVTFSGE